MKTKSKSKSKSAQINSEMLDMLTLILRSFERQRENLYGSESTSNEAMNAVKIKRALRTLIWEVA